MMKGRNVLLVNPWIYDFAAYDLWAKPLGLLSLGALLRKNGCGVDFVDCLETEHDLVKKPGGHGRFRREIIPKPPALKAIPRNYARYGITPDAFVRELRKVDRPDAVLVTSMMTYWYPGVVDAISLIKEYIPDVPVVLGGVYATLCTEHARRFSGADHVLTHEGELKVLKLFEELWGNPFSYVPLGEDPDTLPYPCFDLVDDLRYVCIRASRGCPYRCTYCASHYLCGTQRLRDGVKVADEIEFWRGRYGVKDFAFYDDALLTPLPHAMRLLQEIASRDLGVRFHCPNGLHAREITRETALLMRQAGFATIRLGLETADPVRQRRSGNKVTNTEFIHAMENLHSVGYDSDEIGVYILCGLPGQEASEVYDAVWFVKEHGGRPRLSEYSPIPHTKEWEAAKKSSRYPVEEEPLFQNNTLLPCRSESFSYEQYQEIKISLKDGIEKSLKIRQTMSGSP
ncbi:MAG TPA: radical SAM protein [Desulfomonilia bacterium]|nr:radical SAM protein [Desulfomonilia bacterium]